MGPAGPEREGGASVPPPEVAGALRPPVLPWEPGTQAAVLGCRALPWRVPSGPRA